MLTDDPTAVAAPSPATLRADLRSIESFVLPDKLEVEGRELIRSALETTDPGLRKLNCSVLRHQFRLLRWYHRDHGWLVGDE